MAPFIIAAMALAYTGTLFIRTARARFIYLYAIDAIIIGFIILSGGRRDEALFFAAVSFVLNIYFCMPAGTAPKFTFGRDEFLLSVLGLCVVALAAIFAGHNNILSGQFRFSIFPSLAAAMLFTVMFAAGYFLMRGTGREKNHE